jgi:hypothetical protein
MAYGNPSQICSVRFAIDFIRGPLTLKLNKMKCYSPDKDFHLLINWTPLLLLHFEPSSLKIMEVYFSFVSS